MVAHKWSLDVAHSAVGFSVRHLMVCKIHGAFTRWGGTLELDEQDPHRSRVEVQIEAASVDTKEPQRDAHLRSVDFFDVEKHPLITFESTSVQRSGDSRYHVAGDLTIRGVRRRVDLDFADGGRVRHPTLGDLRAGFSARTTIQRADFGLMWNAVLETGGLAVSDAVEIEIDIQAFRPI
jgi:polyisoprenoid-binding protein YceI